MKSGIIAVAGASGRVGHLVAEDLLSHGHSVRLITRAEHKVAHLAARGAEVHVGALNDRSFLTNVFRGAAAAFVLTPVDAKAHDVNADQKQNVEAIVGAIRDANVRNVVALSSWGADLSETELKRSGIVGCLWLEEGLNQISNLNVVHLRPVWFMENFLYNIGLIKSANINGLAIKSDFAFPMIATQDIAVVASEYLEKLNFSGRTVRYLCGPRDYTMTEVTAALGKAIGKPNLKYIKFPNFLLRKGMIDNGALSPSGADVAIEINHIIESGKVHAEPRSKMNTTPTTLEEFATTTFAPAYRSAPVGPLSDRFGGQILRFLLFLSGATGVGQGDRL
jgi:uncharacterized protein YbjT (DUF2867 family)